MSDMRLSSMAVACLWHYIQIRESQTYNNSPLVWSFPIDVHIYQNL